MALAANYYRGHQPQIYKPGEDLADITHVLERDTASLYPTGLFRPQPFRQSPQARPATPGRGAGAALHGRDRTGWSG